MGCKISVITPQSFTTTYLGPLSSTWMRLPLELCEIIISNLHADSRHDRATLRACSLTCRAFLPACRYRLFYHVVLSSRHSAERFFNTIFQSSTNPIPFIPRLSIITRDMHDHVWLNDALPILATALLEVTFLKLATMSWGLLDENAQTSLLSGFQKVTSLHIWYTSFMTWNETSRFLSSFPSLTNLLTRGITDGTLTEPYTPLPCHLATITMHSRQSMLFNQLLSLDSHPEVHDLQIDMHPRYVKGAGMLLKTLGASLENLKIEYFGGVIGQFSSQPVDS